MSSRVGQEQSWQSLPTDDRREVAKFHSSGVVDVQSDSEDAVGARAFARVVDTARTKRCSRAILAAWCRVST